MIPLERKLLDLLSNNDVTFFIPPYQRNYEWTDEQCSVFLEDIKKTTESNEKGIYSEHFFGTFTFFQTETSFGQPNKLILIDGQQRITTTMLFLIAVRDIIDEESKKKHIDSKYLRNDDVQGEIEYKVKLKQVETDWVAYKKLVLREPLTETEKDSSVYNNYQYFVNKLTEMQNKGVVLMKLVEQGLSKLSVVTIELKPQQNEWENPQAIFESMNSLGKPLSLADLVRNYLLVGLDADKQEKLYKDYWLYIEKVIPGQISNFIRDYMQMHERKSFNKATETNYKKLYSLFKEIFSDVDPEELLRELTLYADLYSYILGGKSDSPEVDRKLQDLRRINVTTAYSFLLSLFYCWKSGKLNEDEVVNVLDAFFVYCARRRILGLTSGENKNFPLLTKCLADLIHAENKKERMFEVLSNQESNLRLPNDIELTRHLETTNFYNFRHCKFYLALIEENITKCRPDLTDKNLQIEHIMPQKLNQKWEKDLGESFEDIHQEYVHSIGNLTLIRHNKELGQKSFDEKKEIYVHNTGLQIAKTKITDCRKWNEKAMKKRAKWIIEYLLLNVLPIPDKMKRINNFIMKEHRGLSFQELQLIGLNINFINDPSIVVRVVGDKDVEFEGKKWKLSPLTKEIYTRKGTVNASGSYQGAQHWEYDGIKLADIM